MNQKLYWQLLPEHTVRTCRHSTYQLLPHRLELKWMSKLRCPRSVYRGATTAPCHLNRAWRVSQHPDRHAWVASLPRLPTGLCASPSVTAICTRNRSTVGLNIDHDVTANGPAQKRADAGNFATFFNSNEQRFANSSTLPASFYVDIHRIVRQFIPTTEAIHQPVGNPGVHSDLDVDHLVTGSSEPLLQDCAPSGPNSALESSHHHDTLLDDALFEETQPTLPSEKIWDITGRSMSHKKQFSTPPHLNEHLPLDDSPGFVAWTAARSLTGYFVKHLYLPWVAGQELPDATALTFLRRHQLAEQRSALPDIDDIIHWGWILAAPGSLSAKRLVALSEHNRRNRLPPVPLWVTHQLLRATYIDNSGLKLLLNECSKNQLQWSDKRDDQYILIVRLLRHSRKSGAVWFEDIVKLAIQIISSWPMSQRQHIANSAWCNKLLSLLALPSSPRPFDTVRTQQAAQLAILRFMHDHVPEILLTREGYRALTRIQLMHPKTPDEQEWARAKSSAWPPWQPLTHMGPAVKTDFPGKTTRLMKVLDRMNDNGYASHEFDVASQVLSGWDTDRSPTIQVRRIASLLPLSKPWLAGKVTADLSISHLVGLARVESTRSVREAWMCFCSYIDHVPNPDRSVLVYDAMVRKLLARPHTSEKIPSALPGDNLTVWPDPLDSRDLVWTSEPVPELKEFIKRMSHEGHKLGPNILADLLNSTTTVTDAEFYLSNSDLDFETQTALLQQNVYVALETITILRKLPTRLLASYIALLARHEDPSSSVRYSESRSELWARDRTPPIFRTTPMLARAWNILRICRPEEPMVWEAFLQASVGKFSNLLDHNHFRLSRAWAVALACLREMRNENYVPVRCTFKMFGIVASLAYRVLLHDSPALRESLVDRQEEPGNVACRLFAEAAMGDDRRYKHWSELMREAVFLASIPTGGDIEKMAWILWLTNRKDQFGPVLDLLQWLQRHESQFVAAGGSMSPENMSAFRIMFEGHWADDEEWDSGSVAVVDEHQHKTFEDLCGAFGWPDDEHVLAYLNDRRGTMGLIRERMQHKASNSE